MRAGEAESLPDATAQEYNMYNEERYRYLKTASRESGHEHFPSQTSSRNSNPQWFVVELPLTFLNGKP
jgi:hypothetical protein